TVQHPQVGLEADPNECSGMMDWIDLLHAYALANGVLDASGEREEVPAVVESDLENQIRLPWTRSLDHQLPSSAEFVLDRSALPGAGQPCSIRGELVDPEAGANEIGGLILAAAGR